MNQRNIKRDPEAPVGARGGEPAHVDAGCRLGEPTHPGDGSPLREMMMIAAPSVVTMTSYTVMGFVDKFMVSRIGPEPFYLPAQGNGGMTAWVLMCAAMGVTGVINSFVSQNLGAGTPRKGSAYAWNAVWFGLGYWAVLMLPAVLLAPKMFELYGHTGELFELETLYARYLIAGSLFPILARALHNYFYGLHKAGVVMVSAVVGNIANVVLNVLLIFGDVGAPEGFPLAGVIADAAGWLGIGPMGIKGAAIATICGGLIEVAIPLALFLSPKFDRAYGTRSAWRLNGRTLRDIFRIGWPAGVTFFNEMVCWQILTVYLIGAGGAAAAVLAGQTPDQAEQARTIANNAGFIALQYMHLSFMPAVGISIATQALVGKAIGAGRIDQAVERTILGLKLTMGYMGVCAVGFVVFREALIGWFIHGETTPADYAELIRVGGWVMICAGVFQVFDAMAITLSAALRGAGDTVWPGVVTIVTSWVFIIGLGWLAVEWLPRLGSIGPWIGASLFIIVVSLLYVYRYLGGKWKTMRLTHDDDLHNLPPDEMAPGASPGAV